MRYFRGGDWQEFDALPDDATLLVRSVGTDNVSKVEDVLREQKIPYFMAAERKDDVRFYVEKERRDEIEKVVREYLKQ
ncbi:MAG TPA: hypothetical protein VJB13_02105 [Candidatus Nanoarchaeia archaeon]|nr:hypothetical protein [Candidatus Nanoarchaeia archaeon]